MMTTRPSSVTAFRGDTILASGPRRQVALAVKDALERDAAAAILVFDDATGSVIDLDLRGTEAEVIARLEGSGAGVAVAPQRGRQEERAARSGRAPRGRGRPALGVISREVTLLPRHWDWLAAEPRSASATLRRLVDEARRTGREPAAKMRAREAAYRFMSAMTGNLPGFEDAVRALFSDDREEFERRMANWPTDLRVYASRLAEAAVAPPGPGCREPQGRPEADNPGVFIEPTAEAGRALLQRAIAGPVTMLNLLRLRRTADYSRNPELAPEAPISGAEAFERYVAHTLPLLRAGGGELLFLAEGGGFLIGPADQRWDRVMLVRQSSMESFMAFASDAFYLAGLGHRTAAVEDSRLLPMVELPGAVRNGGHSA